MNEFFKKGQRVRVTENYAKNINVAWPKDLEETGSEGTVVGDDGWYLEIEFDNKELLEGRYLFLEDELELV